MIPRVEAEAFEKELKGGTTQPTVMTCVDLATKERGSYVVKYRNARGRHSYEFLCISLASFFEITTLEPAAVLLTQELGESLKSIAPEISRKVLANTGWNFGTKYLPGKTLPAANSGLRGDLGRQAARIMAFDVLVSNADRHISRKINLLADAERYWVLDHELAFGWTLDLRGFGSWRAEAEKILAGHVFQNRVATLDPDLGGFTDRLKSLTEREVEGFFAELPEEFSCPHEERIQEHLIRARDQHEDFVRAVLEVGR